MPVHLRRTPHPFRPYLSPKTAHNPFTLPRATGNTRFTGAPIFTSHPRPSLRIRTSRIFRAFTTAPASSFDVLICADESPPHGSTRSRCKHPSRGRTIRGSG